MSPKSILRLPEARSLKDEFISGKFEEFLDDKSIRDKAQIKKLVLTSGKVFYDLIKYREKNKITDIAIIRIEQFYPFEKNALKEIIDTYKNATNIVWVQEEPRNMGAWNFLSNRILDLLDNQKLKCVSRPEGASPAVGSGKISNQQQADLVAEAFKI